jgi:hypothetical protein
MSPTSYQAAPPRIASVAEQWGDVKSCANAVRALLPFVGRRDDDIIGA